MNENNELLERVGYLEFENKIYSIHNGVNTIGRHKDAVVNIKNLAISQQHAVIIVTDGIHYIADVKSSNSTVVSGSKLVPFKLYKLEHESELVFGNLKAKYYKSSSERIFNGETELSQLSTQSLYNAHTQLIHDETSSPEGKENLPSDVFAVPSVSNATTSKDNSIADPIHEAATQVVTWDIPERASTSNISPNVHNCSGQIEMGHPSDQKNDEDKIEGINDNIQLNSEPYRNYFDDSHYELIHDLPEEDTSTDIHEVETQVVNLVESCSENISSQESHGERATEKITNKNMPVAEKTFCTSPTSSNRDQGVARRDIADEENVEDNSRDSIDFMALQNSSTSLTQINKETCKPHEDSSNECTTAFLEHKNNSQSTTTQIVKIKSSQLSKVDSDSDTDIDENNENVNKNPDSYENEEIFAKKKRSVPLPVSQDDEMDVEVKSQKIFQTISTNNLGSGSASGSGEADVGIQKISESNDDEEIIAKKKKSLPLPATQSEETYAEHQENILNDDSSECESDIEDTRLKQIQGRTSDFIIEDTQEQELPEELNDTDCIPATQDVSCTSRKLPIPQISSQKSLSEESFKLGLTEMMTDNTPEPEKLTCPNENKLTEGNIENEGSSNKNGESFCTKSSNTLTISKEAKMDESDDDATDIEENIDENKSSEIHLKLSVSEENSFDLNTMDEFQIEPNKDTCIRSNSNESDTDNEDPEFHFLPTQPIDDIIVLNDIESKQKKFVSLQKSESKKQKNSETCVQPTQETEGKLLQINERSIAIQEFSEDKTQKTQVKETNDSEINLVPTQLANIANNSNQTDVDDICDLPTQKLNFDDSDTSEQRTEDNIYIQSTQKLGFEENMDEVDFRQRANVANDVPSTSKNVFVLPTEKILENQVTSPGGDAQLNEKSKKFSFKKYSLNLDGSLSTILSNGESKEDEKTARTVNVKVNSLNHEKEHPLEIKERPSNPLAIVLDKEKSQGDPEMVSQISAFIKNDPPTAKDNRDVDSETLSQIDAFVKSSDKFLKPTDSPTLRRQNRSPRKIVRKNKPITFEELEDSLNKTAENLEIEVETSEKSKVLSVPVSPVRDSETLSQIDAYIQASTSKPSEDNRQSIAQLFEFDNLSDVDDVKSPDAFLKPSAPSPRRQKNEKLEASAKDKGEASDDVSETISQIDRFINSTDISKPTSEDDVRQHDHETLSQIDAFIKSTDKWVDPEKTPPMQMQRRSKNKVGDQEKEALSLKKSFKSQQKPSRDDQLKNSKGDNKDKALEKNDSSRKVSQCRRTKTLDSTSVNEETSLLHLPTISEESSTKTGRRRVKKETISVVSESNSGDESDKSKVFIARRATKLRKLSSSSSDQSASVAEVSSKKPDVTKHTVSVNSILLDNTMESSRSEVNQSIALLEAKTRKTRKTLNEDEAQEITLRVPKNRRSMALSTIEKGGMESDIKPLLILPTKSIRTYKRNTIASKDESTDEEPAESIRVSRKRTKATFGKSSNENLPVASTSNIEDVASTSKRKIGPKSRVSTRKAKSSEVNDDEPNNTAPAEPSTPKRQRLVPNESLLLNTAERAKRKLKPKVVFTMLDNPSLESSIRLMGGSIVDSVDKATVLVTEHVKRSQKLLSAVGQGKPICSPQWILESKKHHEFLDPWDHILIDEEAESKWNFSLKESLERSNRKKLLEEHIFQIFVTTAADVLKGAIECCGGKVVSRNPGKGSSGKFFVIASPEHKAKYTKLIKQHPGLKVIEPEAIFDGVLRQELRFSLHYLS